MNANLKQGSAGRPVYEYESLEEAFPDVSPGITAFGARVLVQIRTPKQRSKGGIILGNETRETELWNTQVAKVIQVGPLAFRNRDTLAQWPEGDWCKPGDFVRVPKYGGDRWMVVKMLCRLSKTWIGSATMSRRLLEPEGTRRRKYSRRRPLDSRCPIV